MSYDRHWQEDDRQRGCPWSRALGARPDRARLAVARHDRRGHGAVRAGAAGRLSSLSSPRAWAFALLGLDAYLRRFRRRERCPPRPRPARRAALGDLHAHNATPTGPGRKTRSPTPTASFRTRSSFPAAALERPEMVDAGTRLAALADGHPDRRAEVISCRSAIDGWFARGGTPARFDQQPIEAQHMVDALLEASSGHRRPALARRGAPLLRVVPRPQRPPAADLRRRHRRLPRRSPPPTASTRTRAPNRRLPGCIRSFAFTPRSAPPVAVRKIERRRDSPDEGCNAAAAGRTRRQPGALER